MNRRGFLGAMLAACAAPAVVKASSIMRIAPDRGLWLPNQNGVLEPFAGLSMDDFEARVMAPINRALDAYVEDALADAMAETIVREGQIGMVDRFTMYESPAKYPRAFLDGKIVTSEELRWAVGVKSYFEPPGPATARVQIGAKFDPRIPAPWDRPGRRD